MCRRHSNEAKNDYGVVIALEHNVFLIPEFSHMYSHKYKGA